MLTLCISKPVLTKYIPTQAIGEYLILDCDEDSAHSGLSLERIDDYIDIEQEPKPNASGEPPAYWPASGDIKVENLHARYSADGPEVLQNISFHIKSGERIGVGT